MTPDARSPRLPVLDEWFRAEPVGEGLTRITEPAVHPLLQANVWHLRGRDRDLVVDTGLGVASLRQQRPELFERDPLVVVTHAHLDHLGGAHEFDRCHAHPAEEVTSGDDRPASLRAAVLVHQLGLDPRSLPDALPTWLISAVPHAGYVPAEYRLSPSRECVPLGDGDELDLGDRRLRVLVVPGHTPGGVALHDEREGVLFSGDVLYDLTPDEELIDDIVGASISEYRDSLRRLAALDVATVHPGHGPSISGRRAAEIVAGYLSRRGAG